MACGSAAGGGVDGRPDGLSPPRWALFLPLPESSFVLGLHSRPAIQGTSEAGFSGALIAWRILQNDNATTTLVAYSGLIPPTTVTDAQVE